MIVWRLFLLLILLLPTCEGAFSSYLKKLLRAGTTTPPPIRKNRPVEQETGETTDVPETTERPGESTAAGSTQPPSTEVPGGTTTTRCSVGVWSEWREDMSCNAACGACGTVVRRRSCTTAAAGCPCDGDFRETRACRISACSYPQPACCPPATLIYVNGTFACGPQSETVMAEYRAEIAARASSTTRAPTTALIATRPHRTSPTGMNGTTTTVPVTPAPGTVQPTGGPEPTIPTGALETTEEPAGSTGSPVERTTGGREETTAAEEAEVDARPWYHRLKPMSKPVIEETVTPMWLQHFA